MTDEFFCKDCGKNVIDESYMVRDELWETINGGKGFLCMRCVESRLGRPLVPQDFAPYPLSLKDYGDEVLARVNPDNDWIILYDTLTHNQPDPVIVVFYESWDDREILCAYSSEKVFKEYWTPEFEGGVTTETWQPGGPPGKEIAKFVNYKEIA